MKHVVALSGGKDSTALALRLAEVEPRDYIYAITPTGNEPAEMIAHWKKLSDILGKQLTVITGGKSLQGLIKEQKMLPRHSARWCTRILKLEPYYKWLGNNTPCVSYVGLRADEEGRAGMQFPGSDKIEMRFPMKEWGWTIDDVKEYLKEKNIAIPERTDCSLCFWQKIGEWYLLWKDNIDAYMEGERLEEIVSEHRGTVATFRSEDRDSWPASLTLLRMEFERGRVPKQSLKSMDKLRQSGTCRICTM